MSLLLKENNPLNEIQPTDSFPIWSRAYVPTPINARPSFLLFWFTEYVRGLLCTLHT